MLNGGQGKDEIGLIPVAGDASGRAYFRTVGVKPSRILVNSPPATEKNDAFLAVRSILAEAGVRVPAVIAADLGRGYMLLEDLGDKLLLSALNNDSVNALYQSAFDVLLQIASLDEKTLESGEKALNSYDDSLLSEELGRFSEWFVCGLLAYSPSRKEASLINNLSRMLIANALEQPRVLVHRDFHSRNLMLTDSGELAVIDYQDAVLGPVTYDLVSLLRDCYVSWPVESVEAWALQYRDLLFQESGVNPADDEQFIRWFDLMGLQRHLKVLGTFARLYLRDGKLTYLDDLPLVLEYVAQMLDKYAAELLICAEFRQWFNDVLSPLIEKQNWSRPA
jgi:aminoglycoside/choline kinase family phosphotransferase